MTESHLSHLPVEVLAEGDPSSAISQLPVEVLARARPAWSTLSQLPVEVLVPVVHRQPMRIGGGSVGGLRLGPRPVVSVSIG